MTGKNIFYCEIAGFFICIHFGESKWVDFREKLKKEVKNYLYNFICVKKPKKIDYQIDIVWENRIDIIRKKNGKNNYINFFQYERSNKIRCFYRISINEFDFIIQHILAQLLRKNNGFILHGSAVKKGNNAFVFLGKSGTGKSTIRTLLKSKFTSLADDVVIVKKEKMHYFVYQTPFYEKDYKEINKQSGKIKLNRVFFLKKAHHSAAKKIADKNNLIHLLIEQGHIGTDKKRLKREMKKTMEFVDQFDSFYKLYFAKEELPLLKVFADFAKYYI